MGDSDWCSSYDMNSLNDTMAPECSIITMENIVSRVIASVPTDTYNLTNNILHCIDTYIFKFDVDYLPQNLYSYYDGQWGITYHGYYKFPNKKDSGVKYFFCQCGI